MINFSELKMGQRLRVKGTSYCGVISYLQNNCIRLTFNKDIKRIYVPGLGNINLYDSKSGYGFNFFPYGDSVESWSCLVRADPLTIKEFLGE